MLDVVVIDTGLDIMNKSFENKYSGGKCFKLENGRIAESNDIMDDVGHGTGITNIILSQVKVNIIPIKIIDKEYFCDEDVLIHALQYVYHNIKCDVINMSLGINVCNRVEELKSTIELLKNRGTIIVSAFNNDGSMSYPALFDNVIGVDSSNMRILDSQYEYVENSPINIRGNGSNQRVLWLENKYKIVSGTSFAAAHITALVCKYLNRGIKPEMILHSLKTDADHVILNPSPSDNKLTWKMKKAIVFPYNKEIHSVVKFNKSLCFQLVDVFDVRESGNVGKKLITYDESEYTIKNILKVDWDSDFDTLIIGHINVLQKLLNFDIRKYLLLKCKIHKKNIYSFDFLSDDNLKLVGENVFFPYINDTHIPKNSLGKLYHISKPVIGVFGTGSKQGKFTLQLILKRKLEKDGYSVGHLGTEPSALLFGSDKVYPMGYENSVDIKGFDCISILNKYMYEIAQKSEIILVGSQSNTVPPYIGNENYFTTKQIEFLLGTQPDAVILCFNAHDDFVYIERTIKAIEGLVESKVIGAVLFPLKLKDGWAGSNGGMEKITEEDFNKYSDYLMEKHGIKVYSLDDEKDIDLLYEKCLNFFS